MHNQSWNFLVIRVLASSSTQAVVWERSLGCCRCPHTLLLGAARAPSQVGCPQLLRYAPLHLLTLLARMPAPLSFGQGLECTLEHLFVDTLVAPILPTLATHVGS